MISSFAPNFIYRSDSRITRLLDPSTIRTLFGGLIMKSISEYLKHKPGLRGRILDRGELKRVARACGLSPQEARSELRKLGFTLTTNSHGLTMWMKQASQS
jgi:hypothetical protein